MNNVISKPVTMFLVMVYGNDNAHNALMFAGRIVRLLFA